MRVVMTSFGSYGDVNPYLGLALELRDRGHEPVLATSAYYRGYVESENVAFHPVRPDVDPRDSDLLARIMDPARGTEFVVRRLLIPSLRDSFEDLVAATEDADLLVTHPITFAGPLVAEVRGMLWASSVLAPMSFFSESDLPVFPPAPWLKRPGDAWPPLGRLLVRLAKRTVRGWSAPVGRLRRELGLPPGRDPIFEGQHAPDLVLALFSRLLAEPRPDWPPNVRITGAVAFDGTEGARTLDPGLAAFLEAGRPPVVFTLGSSAVAAAGEFFGKSLEAARRLGERAVLLAGPDEREGLAGAATDHVHVAGFAPHSALFPRAAAVVHQGGAGTAHQALRSGRPQLVVPFGHDQHDNAFRVARLGLAEVIPARRYTTSRATSALERLLAGQDVAERASAVGEEVRRERGAAVAADALEELMVRR